MNDLNHLVNKYFGVVVQPQTYLNLVYLLLSFPLGILYFIFLITGVSIGLPLIFLLIGVVILAAVLAVSWQLATFERGLAVSLLHIKIPPMSNATTQSATFWQRSKDYLANPVTWKGLVFLLCKFPLGVINFTLVISILALALVLIGAPFIYPWATYDLGFTVINSLTDALLVTMIGLLVAPAGLHLLNFITRIQGEFARVMLGDYRNAVMQLSQQEFAGRKPIK